MPLRAWASRPCGWPPIGLAARRARCATPAPCTTCARRPLARGPRQPPALLIGHSLGGAAALAAAEALPGVKGVATVGAPFEPGHMVRVLGARAEDGPEEGPVQVELDGHNLLIDKDFLDDLGSARPARWIAELGRFCSSCTRPSTRWWGWTTPGASSRARAPQGFARSRRPCPQPPGDAAYAASMIAAWAARLIPSASPAAGAHAEEVVVWGRLAAAATSRWWRRDPTVSRPTSRRPSGETARPQPLRPSPGRPRGLRR
ncbi:MAG: hypothetical protein R3F43_09085 [bacterium]